MIGKTNILNNLKELARLYGNSPTTKKSDFFAKLAILELCGWIEESMDNLISRCSKKKVKLPINTKYVNDKIIGKTYGFEYTNNFRFMLIRLLGIITVEKLESSVDSAKLTLLQSTLTTLKSSRDKLAHTHTHRVLRNIDAPSVTTRNFLPIYEGLKDIEAQMKKLRLL